MYGSEANLKSAINELVGVYDGLDKREHARARDGELVLGLRAWSGQEEGSWALVTYKNSVVDGIRYHNLIGHEYLISHEHGYIQVQQILDEIRSSTITEEIIGTSCEIPLEEALSLQDLIDFSASKGDTLWMNHDALSIKVRLDQIQQKAKSIGKFALQKLPAVPRLSQARNPGWGLLWGRKATL